MKNRSGSVVLLLACAAAMPSARAADSVFEADPAHQKVTFEFAKLRSKVMAGDKIGKYASGSWCLGSKDLVATARVEEISNTEAGMAFKEVAKDLDVPVFQKEISPFESTTPASADYRIGGTLERLYIDSCSDDKKRKGESNVEVKWEVWSTRQQRVVMSRVTTGHVKTETWVPTFEYKAFSDSLREFLTTQEARDLIAGVPPAMKDAFEPLHVSAHPLPGADTQKNAGELRKAVVTVTSDGGSGSGFFVGDGYVLTDRHVVGSSRFVKLRLSDGSEAVGEVLRQDVARDVALLQTSAKSPSLPVRLPDPASGENLFAIGSPLGQTFEGTFTRGVMSGTRDIEGRRFFQSDVSINKGNSGGPLLDATSHVVGLADWTIPQTTGLSFFVPIKDALEKLNVVVDAAPAGTAQAAAR
jgi:S1-C subfamily serine protease